MDEQTRERLVGELRDYLASLPPDAEAAPARTVDLYSLFTELAGVRNEMRLESRQLKRALDEFSGVFTTLEASGQRLQHELDARRDEQAATRANAERPLLFELIEQRDRLAQAQRLAAAHRPHALARLVARRQSGLIHDLAEGLAITLRRLDQALAAYGLTAIATTGQPIDPHGMRVTATRSDPEQADGTVLEEVQRGYRRNGEVLRLAEVVVNKKEPQS